MSYPPTLFSNPVSVIARQRYHTHIFPDPILIVYAYNGILMHGRPIRIYVSGIDGYYSARMGELHVQTQVSLIYRIEDPDPPVLWYLSFSHPGRQVYHFSGSVCFVHSVEVEEDYLL